MYSNWASEDNSATPKTISKMLKFLSRKITKLDGGYVFTPVCLFVCLSVCLFVNRITPKLLDGLG